MILLLFLRLREKRGIIEIFIFIYSFFVCLFFSASQTLITFAKIARKHRQLGLCMEWLDRVGSLPSVAPGDYYQRMKQIYKCHLYKGGSGNANDLQEVKTRVLFSPCFL